MATADEVVRTKPSPEIDRRCAVELGGARAHPRHRGLPDRHAGGVDAGLHSAAVGTPFPEARLRAGSPLDDRGIVSGPSTLLDTVDVLLAEDTGSAAPYP